MEGFTSHGFRLQAMGHSVWSGFVREIALPMGDIAVGQRMMSRLRHLETAQWWDPERIHKERDRLLALLIHTAYAEVPFYRRLMDAVGVV
jgi:phenylacetate-CoA ligase